MCILKKSAVYIFFNPKRFIKLIMPNTTYTHSLLPKKYKTEEQELSERKRQVSGSEVHKLPQYSIYIYFYNLKSKHRVFLSLSPCQLHQSKRITC